MDERWDDYTIGRALADPKLREQAFTQMVRQYSEPLYWRIRRMVFYHADADDILQNTFLKAWKHVAQFQNKSKVFTWLYRIAINEALDFLRKQKNTLTTPVEDISSLAQMMLADEYFDGDEAEAILHAAIATLPEVQRLVFTLRYFEEMKYAEMSELLGTSEGALKASYHLAVKKISAFIQTSN